jgi:hypothetical protein
LGKIIIYSKEIEFYLNDLIDILFYKDYFLYQENAEKYVLDLKNEIEKYIDVKNKFESPKKFQKYGKNYIIISLNNRSCWFVFFDQKQNRFLIQYITNNHVEESRNLNSNLPK